MIIFSGVVLATAVSAEIDCSKSWDTVCSELGYIYRPSDIFVDSNTECKSAPEPDCYEGRLVCPMADDVSRTLNRGGNKTVYSSVMEITGDDSSSDSSSCEVGDYIIGNTWSEAKCDKFDSGHVKGVVFDPANNLALSFTRPSSDQWAIKNFYTAYECKWGKYRDKECYYDGRVLTYEAAASVTGAVSGCPEGTFLPSIQQMKALYRNKRRVQNAFEVITSGIDFYAREKLWTSNSYKASGYVDGATQQQTWTQVYTFNMKDGTIGTAARYYENDYICIGSYSLK